MVQVTEIQVRPGSGASGGMHEREEEGELASRLSHPHIVQTLGYWTTAGAAVEVSGRSSAGSGGSAASEQPTGSGRRRMRSLAHHGASSGSRRPRSSCSWDEELWDCEDGFAGLPDPVPQILEAWLVMEYCNKGSLEVCTGLHPCPY